MLLVCDRGNHRVQEVRLDGTPVRCIGSTDPCAITLSLQADVIAVSSVGGMVSLHSYSKGAKLRSFSAISRRGATEVVFGYATGLTFSTGSTELFLASKQHNYISVFSVRGEFVKHVLRELDFREARAAGDNSICLAADGNIVSLSCSRHLIEIIDAESGDVITCWGACGGGRGKFQGPRALCTAGTNLFVLGRDFVEIFE